MSEASEMLSRLVAKQDEARKELDDISSKRAAIVQLAKDEGREDLTEEEDTEFRALSATKAEIEDAVTKRDERIKELAEEEERAKNASDAFKRAALTESRISVKKEGLTYERGSGRSFFRDLALAQPFAHNDRAAQERLERHQVEMEMEQRANPNRTDGQGGYFVPPLWLMDEYAKQLRAGRVTANLVQNMPLPGGTDSLNIPKFASGTTAVIQTADGGSVSSTDMTDSSVAAGVKTIAGQQDIAIQLLEQSPLPFDEIIFTDLIADLNKNVDIQVINGANASGEVMGLLTITNGVTTTSYTGSTVASLYSKLAGAINSVHTSRYLPPDTIIMHPRRWNYLVAQADSNGRPLIVPTAAQGPFQSLAGNMQVESEGLVGNLLGLDVYVDPNVPTNLGASTNEDRIIIIRRTDPMLFEGSINTRVLPDVLSANLKVRLQVYKYLAFTGERYPQSISILQGTGLTTPSF